MHHAKHAPMTPEARYEALVETLLSTTNVSRDLSEKKMFGSSALRAGSKVFAILNHGKLVVKLPRQRVDELLAAGAGERFDPGKSGRFMKEWLVVAPTYTGEWLPLAREALEFVAGTP